MLITEPCHTLREKENLEKSGRNLNTHNNCNFHCSNLIKTLRRKLFAWKLWAELNSNRLGTKTSQILKPEGWKSGRRVRVHGQIKVLIK